MKSRFGLLLVFFSWAYVFGQCDDGSNIISLLPNHSFESKTCCPTNGSNMNCVDNWLQASAATPDYINTCGNISLGFVLPPPSPYPDGTGCTGILDRRDNSTIWKELLGTCLTTPLLAGTSYTLQFSIAPGIGNGFYAGNISNLTRDFAIYGAANCNNLPFAGTTCPTGGWNVVHNQTVTMSASSWSTVSFTFTPTFDIYGFILGSSCNNTIGALIPPSVNGISLDYYYLDNMILNMAAMFPDPLPIANAGIDITICASDTATLEGSVTGGSPTYNYSWNNGAGTSETAIVNPDSTTSYTLTVTDNNGCKAIDEVIVSVVAASARTDIISSCDPINWIDGNRYVASNNSATHTIIDGAANGCDSIVTLDFTLLSSSVGRDVHIVCENYTWIDGITYTASNNTATFTLVNAVGCDSIVTLDLTVTTYAAGTDTQLKCGQFTWIDGNTYFASNNTATHTIVGGAAAGCDSIVTLNLTINPLPIILASDDQVLCDGDPVVLNATGSTNIVWSPLATNNVLFTPPLGITTYTATGTDANGCVNTDDVIVTVNDNPNASFSFTNICEGISMDFVSTSSVNNGTITSADWSFGDDLLGTGVGAFTNYLYGAPNTYDVMLTVTSNKGCTSSVVHTVEVYENPVAAFSSLNTSGCADLCVEFNNNSSTAAGVITNYFWTLGNGSVDVNLEPKICYINSGYFDQSYDVSLTVTTDLGCVSSIIENGFVTVHPVPIADFEASIYETTVLNTVIDFENQSVLGSTYAWDFDGVDASIEQNPTHIFQDLDTATYEVCLEVTSINRCVDDTCKIITISGFEGLYVPNAFSPNNDGRNDLFVPQLEGISDLGFEFLILNRWGELIYKSTDPKDVIWDGVYKSILMQMDVYVWKMQGMYQDSRKHIDRTGYITLIK